MWVKPALSGENEIGEFFEYVSGVQRVEISEYNFFQFFSLKSRSTSILGLKRKIESKFKRDFSIISIFLRKITPKLIFKKNFPAGHYWTNFLFRLSLESK